MPTFRLVMRSGPAVGKIFPLEKTELFLGRDLNNDVVINDPEVSRRHARFFMQGNSFYLEDLGSTNGTFINGQRLASPYPLRVGEAITFGERINVVFEMDAPDQDSTMVASAVQPARAPENPFAVPPPPPPTAFQQQPQAQVFSPPPQPIQQQPLRPIQPPPPPQQAYVGQVPRQAPPVKSGGNTKTIIIILIILLVVICLCVMVGLYLAPKEFWCMLPIWPAGACN